MRRSALHLTLMSLAVSALACGAVDAPQPMPVTVEVEVTRVVTITREVPREVPRDLPVTVEVTGLAVPTVDLQSAPYEVGSLTGTYGWSTDAQGPQCQLVILHRILLTSQHVLEFELACQRGAPSFNQGYLVGLAPMQDDIALYTQWNSALGETCAIVFDLSAGDGAEVIQLGSDAACGFGQGVDATGSFLKLNADFPTIGCLSPEGGCP